MLNKPALWLVALLVAALSACTTQGPQPPTPQNRAEAIQIIADMRRIVTPNGVERLEAVRIGGIDQWVSIRGADRRNPILLMIHGGPGHVSMPTAWYFQRGWEEYFTVVQWDQRGAGRTYAANDPDQVAPTMTRAQMIADTEEIIQWLRQEFGKERIFVLGHSWGTYLGLTIAQRHPDWLHVYIGMGQMVDLVESERRGWAFAMAAARRDNNAEAIRDLASIAPYAENGPPTLEHFGLQRRWLNHYGGAMYGRTGFDAEAAATALSPDYTDNDLRQLGDAYAFSEGHLLADVIANVDFTDVTTLETPMILLAGRHDHNVSSEVAAEWFARLRAPSKQIVWFENAAHEIMNEEPGATLIALVTHARPIAARAGDVAP